MVKLHAYITTIVNELFFCFVPLPNTAGSLINKCTYNSIMEYVCIFLTECHQHIYIYIYIYKCSQENLNVPCWMFFFFFCPDGITPNSDLTGPNTTIYIYIYIYIYIRWNVKLSLLCFFKDALSIEVHVFPTRMLTSFSVAEMLLWRYVNWSSNFRGLPLKVKMVRSCLKHMNCILFGLTKKPLPLASCSRLRNLDSA